MSRPLAQEAEGTETAILHARSLDPVLFPDWSGYQAWVRNGEALIDESSHEATSRVDSFVHLTRCNAMAEVHQTACAGIAAKQPVAPFVGHFVFLRFSSFGSNVDLEG